MIENVHSASRVILSERYSVIPQKVPYTLYPNRIFFF